MAKLEPDLNIGGYRLIRQLGKGGMGEVWLGQDSLADRHVALKFIQPFLLADAGFRTRFINEAKTLGRLEHDRIVTLYSVLDVSDHLALVLRFIDGKSLEEKILEKSTLPLSFVVSCARDILPALGFAHDRRVIHRDIKPPNILLDGDSRCFLMDFGIAVADFAKRGTMTGAAMGTPHYMSPEQIRAPQEISSDSGGHRTDIYSFGIVLHEMLTGRVPFGNDWGAEQVFAIQDAHCNQPPPGVREYNPDVPPAVEEVILSCLEKDPDRRPQTCIELLAQLESAALSGGAERARHYAKTVVENTNRAVPRAAAVGVPAPLSKSRKVPQVAWYGVGAACIAGGVSFTIWTSHHDAPVTTAPHDRVITTPSITTPSDKARLDAGHKSTHTAAIGSDPGQLSTSATNTAAPNLPKPVDPSIEERARAEEARRDANTARNMMAQDDNCGAIDNLKKAISLDPRNSEYSGLLKSATNGCNTP